MLQKSRPSSVGLLLLAAGASLILAACGGASSSTGAQLTGTAAYGAPLSGARIEVLDATGRTVAATADENGEYRVAVDGLQAPLLVTASALSGESLLVYRAIGDAVPAAGSAARVNVTPLTDAVVALASSDGGSPEEFADPSGAALRKLDAAKLREAEAAVKAGIKEFAAEAGQPDFDPVRSPFKADSVSPGDKVLDLARVSMHSGQVRIEAVPGLEMDPAASALSANTSPAAYVPSARVAVVIDSQQVSVRSGMAPGPWDGLAFPKPYQLTPMFNAWLTKMNTCFALAPQKRATVDASGAVTGLARECQGLVSTDTKAMFSGQYLNDGYSLLESWGARLRREIPQYARMQMPQIVGFHYRRTGAVEPVVAPKGVQQMVLRLSWNSAQGSGSLFEIARRTGKDTWQILGNEQEYDAGVSAMITREEDVSTNGYVPMWGPDAGKNVGFFDAYVSRLSLRFNPAGPNAKRVYAVRVKGPGLPAAGVVLARSSVSGTGDFLGFVNSDGSLPTTLPAGGLPLLSNLGANTFVLAVTPMSATKARFLGQDFFNEYRGRNPDGSPSTSPTSRIAYPQVDVRTIPLFAEYTFEVFKSPEQTTPATGDILAPGAPASTFTTRLLTRPIDPALGAKQPWAKLSVAGREYLKPGGQFAGELTSATISWSAARTDPPVQSAYFHATGFDGNNAFYRVFMNAKTSFTSGTAMTLSSVNGVDGNGRPAAFSRAPAFSATKGSREIALGQTRADGLLLRSAVFHNGRAY